MGEVVVVGCCGDKLGEVVEMIGDGSEVGDDGSSYE